MTTPTIGQYLNLDKYQAPQWLGDRAKSRLHVMVKAAARALARCGPAQLVGAPPFDAVKWRAGPSNGCGLAGEYKHGKSESL